jgi:hypothetical protein
MAKAKSKIDPTQSQVRATSVFMTPPQLLTNEHHPSDGEQRKAKRQEHQYRSHVGQQFVPSH